MNNKSLFIRSFGVHLLLSLFTAWLLVGVSLATMDKSPSEVPVFVKLFGVFVQIIFLPLNFLSRHLVDYLEIKAPLYLIIALVMVNSGLIAATIVAIQNAVAFTRMKFSAPSV